MIKVEDMMEFERQKPTSEEYRNNWERIFGRLATTGRRTAANSINSERIDRGRQVIPEDVTHITP
jgi:hypothetical protein